MDDLVFFDLNGVLGTPVFDPDSGSYSGYRDVRDLLNDMDYFGVDYALVSHYRCLHGSPRSGNELLLRELAQRGASGAEDTASRSRLFPCWVLLPGSTGEVPSGKELAEDLRKAGVRAVRIDFGAFNLPAVDRVMEDLFTVLEDCAVLAILASPSLGVPVPEREEPFLQMLDRVLDGHRGLNVVTGGRLRSIFPLMERYGNLYLSMEWDSHPDFVEEICRRFSAGRLLFATPYSENARENSGMPMLMITHADVPEADMRRIAGANLAALLGMPAAQLTPVPELPGRRQFASLLSGAPAGYAAVDIHAHAGCWSWEYKPGADPAAVLRVMNRTGVETMCVNATEAVLGGDHIRANADLAAELEGLGDRFIPFAVVNPHFSDCAAYIDSCIGELGFRGIKIHPRTHRCAITDPKYRPVWEASEKHRVPVLCHTGEGQAFSEPEQFHEVAPRYPKGIFIVGHTGETFAGMLQAIALANRYGNIYLEISGWLFMKWGFLEYLAKRVDVRRILFGSDYSWIDLRYALAIVLFSRLGEREKRMILGENSRRLLGLGGAERG
ncbi:MAG: amidohydrolase family protein [Spirochaetales bacterium]|nr:amidohydrolase family protein [Spirochaetales bacterium]